MVAGLSSDTPPAIINAATAQPSGVLCVKEFSPICATFLFLPEYSTTMSLMRRRSKDKEKKVAAEGGSDLTGYVRELRKGTDAVQSNLDAGARGMRAGKRSLAR